MRVHDGDKQSADPSVAAIWGMIRQNPVVLLIRIVSLIFQCIPSLTVRKKNPGRRIPREIRRTGGTDGYGLRRPTRSRKAAQTVCSTAFWTETSTGLSFGYSGQKILPSRLSLRILPGIGNGGDGPGRLVFSQYRHVLAILFVFLLCVSW